VLVVLTVGLLLSLFNAAVGIGVSIRVPFTDSNLTVAGSVGQKQKAVASLPGYTDGRLGGNQNFHQPHDHLDDRASRRDRADRAG
jgi:hypothetical protein